MHHLMFSLQSLVQLLYSAVLPAGGYPISVELILTNPDEHAWQFIYGVH